MRAILLSLATLAVTTFAVDCGCGAASISTFFTNSDSIFFGGVLSGSGTRYTLQSVKSVKGCVATNVNVTVDITCTSATPVLGQIYLLGGSKVAGTSKILRVKTLQCGWYSSLASNDSYWLMNQVDKACTKPVCADGTQPLTCRPLTCPTNLKSVCSTAASCVVNGCGGSCSPQFFNTAGKPVCQNLTTCLDGSKPLTCKQDTCRATSPLTVAATGCTNWPLATRCVPNTCISCDPVWTDQFGEVVCGNTSNNMVCRDVSNILFGNANLCPGGMTTLGYAVQKGKCAAVSGCGSSPVKLWATMKECALSCQCSDISNINLGKCNVALGFGMVGTKCAAVKGCAANVPARALFTTLAACQSQCAPLPAPTTPPPTCAVGKPWTNCTADPCAIAWPPNCNEAKGRNLVCESSYCGGCKAIWRDHTPATTAAPNSATAKATTAKPGATTKKPVATTLKPGATTKKPVATTAKPVGTSSVAPAASASAVAPVFTCPASSFCDPKASNCCLSGYLPADCSNIRCPFESCANAARCSADSCSRCQLHFYDTNNNEIPVELCQAVPTPPPAPTCDPSLGASKCCSSGIVPLTCPTGQDSICSKLKCLDSSHNLISIGSCTTDPCSNCLPAVRDANQAFISLDQCYVVQQNQCPGTVCPAVTPQCGPIPPACAAVPGLTLKCIMDPCACLSLWVDSVLGVQPSCVPADWQRPCIPDSACPKNLTCQPLPDVPPEVQKYVKCERESCTCRSMLTLNQCIPPSACPASFTCAAPPIAEIAGLTPELLSQFKCIQSNCTCQPVLVPPARLLQPACTPADKCPKPNCENLYLQLEQAFPSSVVRRLVCGSEACSCKPVLSAPSSATPAPGG